MKNKKTQRKYVLKEVITVLGQKKKPKKIMTGTKLQTIEVIKALIKNSKKKTLLHKKMKTMSGTTNFKVYDKKTGKKIGEKKIDY